MNYLADLNVIKNKRLLFQ